MRCLSSALTLLLAALASPAAAQLEPVCTFDPSLSELPESVTTDGQGMLYVSVSNRVHRVTRTGDIALFATLPIEAFALGVKWGPDHCLYTASTSLDPNVQGAFVFRICAPHEVETFATLDPLGGPNDMAFDDAGALYVTDPFLGRIWKIGPGEAPRVWLEDPRLEGDPSAPALLFHIQGVNGIAFDVDKENLYVGNLDRGCILRIEVDDEGRAGEITEHAVDPRLVGADGIAFDRAGRLLVAVNATNRIAVVDRDGSVEILAEGPPLDGPSSIVVLDDCGRDPELFVTNGAFLRAFGFAPGTPTPALLRMSVVSPGLALP